MRASPAISIKEDSCFTSEGVDRVITEIANNTGLSREEVIQRLRHLTDSAVELEVWVNDNKAPEGFSVEPLEGSTAAYTASNDPMQHRKSNEGDERRLSVTFAYVALVITDESARL